ncbi:DegT/DnrJ/EryC1/StrS family aminotransferase [Halovivax cerinus]|uniref:DegT/DnrJ/EryC1/StrS family aminotransferase n=1 Tax=Halovivax cerinus TaxID=1487865 RepID=A0ABD5NMW1_9EURY|nr:DegT/DnrJ/EryC1/StrS family aminotransferase [Halovivax cerinus]
MTDRSMDAVDPIARSPEIEGSMDAADRDDRSPGIDRPTHRSNRRPADIFDFVERYVDDYWLYGSGKVALRDVVAAMLPSQSDRAVCRRRRFGREEPSDRRWNVLLPAYVPDAVPEPLRELGVEPRYYVISPELKPSVADVRRRVDGDTIAIVTIDYFGFPQPARERVASVAREYDCYLVDDNAHATLSVSDGHLLGTRGDAGVTSLWKTFPVPNGAICYVRNEALRGRFEQSDCSGVRGTLTGADARFVFTRAIRRALDRRPGLSRRFASVEERFYGAGVAPPAARYEAAKRPCSKLTAVVCARTDPIAVRDRRRQTYRAWLDACARSTGVRPLFGDLPEGICPQCAPVEADRPGRVRNRLTAAGIDVHTWPRLPTLVRETPTYATAQYLADHVLALPVDRRVQPEQVASVGASL